MGIKLTKKWFIDEYNARLLPVDFSHHNDLLVSIIKELNLFFNISGYILSKDGEVSSSGDTKVYVEPSEYFGLVNLLINRFPDYFSNKLVQDTYLNGILKALNFDIGNHNKKHGKATLKNYRKLLKRMGNKNNIFTNSRVDKIEKRLK